MKVSKNEQMVLDILRKDPYVSQKDLAQKMHVSRPAVANIISGLQQKGLILGKPYVLKTDSYIMCVGGANMDHTFKLEESLLLGTSNPIHSALSQGGVIRNVAENLARFESKVALMSVVGDDVYGDELIDASRQLMETFAMDKLQGQTTGGYYSVIEKSGNMTVGFADMAINDAMNRSWILSHKRHLYLSSWIVADLNIRLDAVESLIHFSQSEDIPLAIIGVSSPKMKHLPKDLEGVEAIICNKDETQVYFDTYIDQTDELCRKWLQAGVKKAVVTDGINGSYYGENNQVMHQKASLVSSDKVVDVTGAGDAFSGAIVYGLTQNLPLKECVKLGAMSACLTIQHPLSVHPQLSMKLIQKEIEKSE